MSGLIPHPSGRRIPGSVVCVVMDGIGEAPATPGNAVTAARTPTLDHLKNIYPWRTLWAHGVHVGMPSSEDMGNSEVGHNTLGGGRIFDQGAKLVEVALESGDIFRARHWQTLVERSLEGGTLHFLGLISDGNVHSHLKHLKKMIEQAITEGVSRVRVHGLLDGRDVGEFSALDYFAPLESWMSSLPGDVRFASGGGRMAITMDRYEADWLMVEKGWKVHVEGEAPAYPSAVQAIEDLRRRFPGKTDQWIPPFTVSDSTRSGPPVQDGDSVVLFNFRGDRAIEISRAFAGTAPFETRSRDVFFAGMMLYDGDLGIPEHYLVEPPQIDHPLSQWFCETGLRQLACSETQKFGHVTYFWNGNRSVAFNADLETSLEIPSDNVPFDQRPWMKAAEITDAVIAQLDQGYDHIRLNYANGDMVGHTGHFEAARMAVEAVDLSLGRLVQEVLSRRGALLVTADHGNVDLMFREEGGERVICPSHSLNPVPCILVTPEDFPMTLTQDPEAGLANVAATLCELLGYHPPENYRPSLLG